MYDLIAELAGNLVLKLLDLVGLEFDYLACVYIEDMIVVLFMRCLEPRTTPLKGMAMHHALLFEHR